MQYILRENQMLFTLFTQKNPPHQLRQGGLNHLVIKCLTRIDQVGVGNAILSF